MIDTKATIIFYKQKFLAQAPTRQIANGQPHSIAFWVRIPKLGALPSGEGASLE
jgi:hypothetical protein